MKPVTEGKRERISLPGCGTYGCSSHTDIYFQGNLLSTFFPCIKNVWGLYYQLDPRHVLQTTEFLPVTSRDKNELQETNRFKGGTILCPLKEGVSDLSRLDLTKYQMEQANI